MADHDDRRTPERDPRHHDREGTAHHGEGRPGPLPAEEGNSGERGDGQERARRGQGTCGREPGELNGHGERGEESEQARPKRGGIDHRADVYSLGATLYEVLTLRAPFEDAGLEDVYAQIATRDPLPPRRLNARVPADLETIVLKAMRKDRDRRYATALELARDLRRFAEGVPIHARRIGPLGRAWRRVRRQKIVSALVAGLLVAVAVGAFFMHRSEVEARRRAELAYSQLCGCAEESMIRVRLSSRVTEQDLLTMGSEI